MTIIHEKGSELHWKDVRELVVGEYVPLAGDTATLFRGGRDSAGDTGPGEYRGLEFATALFFSAPSLGYIIQATVVLLHYPGQGSVLEVSALCELAVQSKRQCVRVQSSVVNKYQNEDQRERAMIGEFTAKRTQEERIRVDPRKMRGVSFGGFVLLVFCMCSHFG